MRHIIDLSSNNGEVDFHQLCDIDEIFIRASLGYGDHDTMLHANAERADALGFTVSYYHFAYPDTRSGSTVTNDATYEARYFCSIIKALPAYAHLVVDLEPKNASGADTSLSREDYALWLQTFLDEVEKETGKQCIIYSYADYLNRHLPEGHAFGKYPLWIANYNENKEPPLPKGWDKYYLWQYSEKGTMKGINGHVDLSRLKA